jgi:hypothetical protein
MTPKGRRSDQASIKIYAINFLTRFGYIAHGVMYLLVGTLAVVAAFDWRARTTDAYGAMATFLSHDGGKAVLVLLAAGLVSFSIWSALQCIMDAERLGRSFVSILVRAGFLGSSVGHLLLCFAALNLVFGWEPPKPDAEGQIKDWSYLIFALPGGRWFIVAVALVIFLASGAIIRNGWTGGFKTRLADDRFVRCLVIPLGRVGLISQGTTFCLIGVFLLAAALLNEPDQARGVAGLLGALKQQPNGWILLMAAAVGLMTYGIYGMIQSFCRKVQVDR